MKKWLLVLGVVLLSLILTGCWTPKQMSDDKVADVVKEVVKIGVIAPLSWPAASFGEDAVNAYKMAIENLITKWVISTWQIQMIFEDGRCSGKDAVTAIQKLINIDQVDVVLWWVCSTETIPAGEIAQQNKVPMLSPTSSSPTISWIGDYIYRFWTDVIQTEYIAEYLSKYDLKNIAILHETTDYATVLANGLMDKFEGNVVKTISINTEEKDFNIIAKSLSNLEDLDAIVVIPNNDSLSIGIVQAIKKEWIDATIPLIGSEIFMTTSVIETLWELAENQYATLLPSPADMWVQAEQILSQFKKSYEVKSADQFVILEYEAVALLVDAIAAGNNNRESIQSYLQWIDKNNKRSWHFGEYYFNESWDAVGLSFTMWKVVSGALVPLDTL